MIFLEQISPQSSYQRLYCIIVCVSGSLLLAYIRGSLAQLVKENNRRSTVREDHQAFTSRIMCQLSIPEEIQGPVQEYQNKVNDIIPAQCQFKDFLNCLSPYLQYSILTHLNLTSMKTCHLFKNVDKDMERFILNSLRVEVCMSYEMLAMQDDFADKLYIINDG